METLLSVVSYIAAHYQQIAAAIAGLFFGVDAILVLIPGCNPLMFDGAAKFLQKISIQAPK